jgi:hypothetical protein
MVLYCVGITIVVIDVILILISAAVIIKKKSWPSWESLFKNSTLWQSLLVAVALLAIGAGQLSSEKNLNFAKEQTRLQQLSSEKNLNLAKEQTLSQQLSSEKSLNLAKKQISLQFRPFITVVNPAVIFNPDNDETRYWMAIVCDLQNFGLQPAHEYKKKNDRLLRISFLPNLLSELEKIKSGSGEYSRQDIDKKFRGQGISCYGDVCKYFDPPTVISPKQIKPSTSNRDVGENYGQAIASGHEAFMYFLYLTYEGSIAGKEYSTFYICYYDEYLNNKYKGDAQAKIGKLVPLSEYRQWMDREGL